MSCGARECLINGLRAQMVQIMRVNAYRDCLVTSRQTRKRGCVSVGVGVEAFAARLAMKRLRAACLGTEPSAPRVRCGHTNGDQKFNNILFAFAV